MSAISVLRFQLEMARNSERRRGVLQDAYLQTAGSLKGKVRGGQYQKYLEQEPGLRGEFLAFLADNLRQEGMKNSFWRLVNGEIKKGISFGTLRNYSAYFGYQVEVADKLLSLGILPERIESDRFKLLNEGWDFRVGRPRVLKQIERKIKDGITGGRYSILVRRDWETHKLRPTSTLPDALNDGFMFVNLRISDGHLDDVPASVLSQ